MSVLSCPIGIFDSGYGGLTVLEPLIKAFPGQAWHYIGDCKRAPYGCRDTDDLLSINREVIAALAHLGVKCVVMACNTSCATVIDTLRAENDIPIFSLITAAAAIVKDQKKKRIAIIATPSTVDSGAYGEAIRLAAPGSQVLEIPCPELVSLVESDAMTGTAARRAVKKYAQAIQAFRADVMIHGCSHYPHFEWLFQAYLPHGEYQWINPAHGLIAPLRSWIQSHQQTHLTPSHLDSQSPAHVHFWISSGYASGFRDRLGRLGWEPIPHTVHEQCLGHPLAVSLSRS